MCRLQRAHLLGGGAQLERVVDPGGAAVLRVARVQLQNVLRSDRQVETPQAAVTPANQKTMHVNESRCI